MEALSVACLICDASPGDSCTEEYGGKRRPKRVLHRVRIATHVREQETETPWRAITCPICLAPAGEPCPPTHKRTNPDHIERESSWYRLINRKQRQEREEQLRRERQKMAT